MSLRGKIWLLLALPLVFCVSSARAQGYYQFLGEPRQVPDRYSPKYGIRYNTQGYDDPAINPNKRRTKLQKKRVPDDTIDEILSFPGSPDAIGDWIDDSFEYARNQFTECGGPMAGEANQVNPRKLYVIIMPSAFYEPYYKVDVAGVYYPSTHQIRVLNIYYTWSGANAGWLRQAHDLLKWEMGNFMGSELKVQPEPRPDGWPCNAPPLQ
jgi:hypothetical protein